MQIRVFFFAAGLFVSSSALAKVAFFLEPYIGVSQFVQKQELSNFTATDVANGFHLGVRGGLHLGKVWFLGGEYFRAGPYTFEDDFFGATSSENTNILIGAVLGGDFDIIRISASYFPDYSMTESGGSSTLTGSAYRIGFGLKVGKKIRANLDYFIHTLDTQEFASGTESTLSTEIKGETAAASVSFPFEFE